MHAQHESHEIAMPPNTHSAIVPGSEDVTSAASSERASEMLSMLSTTTVDEPSSGMMAYEMLLTDSTSMSRADPSSAELRLRRRASALRAAGSSRKTSRTDCNARGRNALRRTSHLGYTLPPLAQSLPPGGIEASTDPRQLGRRSEMAQCDRQRQQARRRQTRRWKRWYRRRRQLRWRRKRRRGCKTAITAEGQRANWGP